MNSIPNAVRALVVASIVLVPIAAHGQSQPDADAGVALAADRDVEPVAAQPRPEALPPPVVPEPLAPPPPPPPAIIPPAIPQLDRPSPVGPIVTVAPGSGVLIQSADGRYSIGLRGRVQIRETVVEVPQGAISVPFACGSAMTASSPGSGNAACNLTEVRRARLQFNGTIFSPLVRYQVLLGFAGGDLEHIGTVSPTSANYADLPSPLLDAYVHVGILRDAQIRVGQYLVPWAHARYIGEGPTQFVERSNEASQYSLDRDIGATLMSDDFLGQRGVLSYALGIFGGRGRNRLPVADQGFGLLYVARVQVAPLGGFDDMVEADLLRSPRPRLAISAGGAWNQNAIRQGSNTGNYFTLGGYDYGHLYADVVWKWRGWSVLAETQYRGSPLAWGDCGQNGRSACPATGTVREYTRSGYGWMVQSGFMLTSNLEVAGRFASSVPVGPNAAMQRDPAWRLANETTGVVSWYFHGHDLKVQADYTYLFSDHFDAGAHQMRLQLAATL